MAFVVNQQQQRMNKEIKNIDEYISSFPQEIQQLLNQVRSTIQQAAPEAQEAIKYAMPTYVLGKNLVHFAAYEKHIGFYPTPSGIEAFKAEIDAYKWSKGAVQFPLDKPLPLDLISRIVKFRVEENQQKMKKKKA